MKKVNEEKKEYRLNAADNRFKRSLRKRNNPRRKTNKSSNYEPPIEAPSAIDIYNSRNHGSLLGFIARIKKRAKAKKTVFISFRNTRFITAAAGLLLVAEIDKLVKQNPQLRIKCSFPPKVSHGRYKNPLNLVESALKQIGFFTLIGKHSAQQTNQASVKRWSQLSGSIADGSLAAQLLNKVSDVVSPGARKKMYRGAIEAIANCVEHAYPSEDEDISTQDSRWWMLVGVDDQQISVVICDLGVGIPVTIQKHPEKILEKLLKFMDQKSDADMIRASTYVRKTRTEMSHRGKGGQDIRSLIEEFPTAQLTIRSNKGAFVLIGDECSARTIDRKWKPVSGTNGKERLANFKNSVGGTIIEWVLSTKDLSK